MNDLNLLKIKWKDERPYAIWKTIETKGVKPSPRSSHIIISYGDEFLIVIGGEGYPEDADIKHPSPSKGEKQRNVLDSTSQEPEMEEDL